MTKQDNSAVRYRHEYVKHFKKNFLSILVYPVAFVTISVIVTICAVLIINPMAKNCASIRECNYDYAVESQNKSLDCRRNYKLENLVTFLNADNRINVNTYLSSDVNNGVISLNNSLKSDEVAVSKQIADRLGVKEGDRLQVDLPIYDMPATYHVKEIIPYVSDYYKIDDNKYFAVAFLGYDEKIERYTNGKYVFFLTDSEFEQFSQSYLDYDQKYYVRGELGVIENKVRICTAVILCVMFLIACIYHVKISKIIKSEVIKYLKDSFPISVIKKFYREAAMFVSITRRNKTKTFEITIYMFNKYSAFCERYVESFFDIVKFSAF